MKIITDKNVGEFDGVFPQLTAWLDWQKQCLDLMGSDEHEFNELDSDHNWEFFKDCYLAGMVPYMAVKEFKNG